MNGDPSAVRFVDLEFEIDGIKFMWTGEGQPDQDGSIIQIDLEWLGEGPGSIVFAIPSRRSALASFKDQVVVACATALETKYADEIKHSVDEWHVSLAEREWEPLEAAE